MKCLILHTKNIAFLDHFPDQNTSKSLDVGLLYAFGTMGKDSLYDEWVFVFVQFVLSYDDRFQSLLGAVLESEILLCKNNMAKTEQYGLD